MYIKINIFNCINGLQIHKQAGFLYSNVHTCNLMLIYGKKKEQLSIPCKIIFFLPKSDSLIINIIIWSFFVNFFLQIQLKLNLFFLVHVYNVYIVHTDKLGIACSHISFLKNKLKNNISHANICILGNSTKQFQYYYNCQILKCLIFKHIFTDRITLSTTVILRPYICPCFLVFWRHIQML